MTTTEAGVELDDLDNDKKSHVSVMKNDDLDEVSDSDRSGVMLKCYDLSQRRLTSELSSYDNGSLKIPSIFGNGNNRVQKINTIPTDAELIEIMKDKTA